MDVLPLSSNHNFHFEILRCLSLARYGGADTNDVLQAAGTIKAGDFESWYNTWRAIADRTHKAAPDSKTAPVAARDRLFAAATYYRAADFFLHGDPADPRINEIWKLQIECFDQAISLIDYPAQRHTLKGDGFEVKLIFYQAKKSNRANLPTIILGNGYDGAQEELLHQMGFAALERGYNVITYEGPGQPTVVREQKVGFIHDWERAITPVIDFAVQQSCVDPKRIALVGNSFGGYLALRAAAFEHRLAAIVLCDGVWSFGDALTQYIPPESLKAINDGHHEQFDKGFTEKMNAPDTPVSMKWGFQQGMWSFCETSPARLVQKIQKCTMEGLADKVQCPVLDLDAEEDLFFKGQPEKVKKMLGDKATYRLFTRADGGYEHCQIGALVLLNQEVFQWLDEKMDVA